QYFALPGGNMKQVSQAPELILVTGATGWLGKRFVRLMATRGIEHEIVQDLPANLRIRCLALPGADADELQSFGPNVEVFTGDLRNPDDCARFTEGARGAWLFHTAGIIHPDRVKDFYGINVEGARNLIAAAERARVRRMVAVSSNSPLGNNPHTDHLF